MSGASSAFLTKSIILLALVLISMGTSMYFGKELGQNIMSLTKSNLENRMTGTDGTGGSEDDGFVLDLVDDRSSFDYDSESFGENQFQRDWADPADEELPPESDEASVDVTILTDDEAAADSEDGDTTETEVKPEGEETQEDSEEDLRTRGNMDWGLGDETTYRIQVGTYDERENAETVWHDLTTAGYDASISTFTEEESVRYRVQVGTYHNRDEALTVAEQIRSMGFDAWVFELQSE